MSNPVIKSTILSATRIARFAEPFAMHRGGELTLLEVAYETWGRLSPARDNAILIFTGLSASAHAASSPKDPTPGWWEFMIGPGKALDTDRYFVICVNSLGSCFGSTGPASLDPAGGGHYRLKFPELAVEDIAAAGRRLLDELSIERLDTVIGASLGGMAALALGLRFPGIARRMVVISASANATPFAIAIRSLQRDIIRNDPHWREGDYSFDDPPANGMRLARKLGLTSYRSAHEWDERFGRDRSRGTDRPGGDHPFAPEFAIESYLEHNASKFVSTFDPNCYLYLSRAMDWFDANDYGASLDVALASIEARDNLVVGVESDILFPIRQQQHLAEALDRAGRRVTLARLPSLQGHDAFLVDERRFAATLGKFLA